MASRRRIDSKKAQYEHLTVLASSLATQIEECWLGTWPDAPWDGWGAESQRAVSAVEDACAALLRICDLLAALPADPD